MSFATSLFSQGRRLLEELTSPLFKSPELNFAQEVAANPLNRNIELTSVSRPITEKGKHAFDPGVVFSDRKTTYDFVRKLSTPNLGVGSGGQIFEVYYTKAPLPTAYHMINNRMVASVKIVTSETKEKARAILRRDRLRMRITDNVVQLEQNKNFNAQIINDISNWNGAMQLKLMTIFLSCIAFWAMISIVVIKVTFVAVAALTALRLLQLYSLQKKNTQIIHVGHWVVQLWQSFSLNPMLRRQYGQYYDEVFYSERRILEYKPTAGVKTKNQNRTVEKTPAKFLGFTEYDQYCKEFRKFADPLNNKECETAEEQHQRVAGFLDKNPFETDFFKDNREWMPGLERKWQRIHVFQYHYKNLKQLYDNLRVDWPRIQKHQKEAKTKCEQNKSKVVEAAIIAAKDLNLDVTTVQLYKGLLLQAFEEEYSSKIAALCSITVEHRGLLAYSQVDDFFNKAYHELILKKEPFVLIPASVKKMVSDFQEQLDNISQNYPQNVIEKAKALSADSVFHAFVDRVFNPE